MKPTPAETENGMSLSHSATMPPTAPNGTPVKTRMASTARPYVRYNKVNTSSSAIGTTIKSRWEARSRFSN